MNHDNELPPYTQAEREAIRRSVPPIPMRPDQIERTVRRAETVRGGQGRDEVDVRADASALTVLGTIALLALAVTGLWHLLGGGS